MTKRKRKARGKAAEPKSAVSLYAGPSSWDMGASGPANRAGMVSEPRGEMDPETGEIRNPNGVMGARRIDNLEIWHNCFLGGKRNRAWITTEQYNIALLIRGAYEHTQRAPGTDYSQERVDSSLRPDAAIMVQITRISKLHSVICRIPQKELSLITHSAVMGRHPLQWRWLGRKQFNNDLGLAFDTMRSALDMAAELR